MLQMPFKGDFPLTQKFNDIRYRASYTKFGMQGHNGRDYGTPVGTPILAPHGGTVKETDYFDSGGYGWYVKITNEKEGSVLAHFKEKSPLKPGDTVKAGDLIGYSGNTGNSSGPHLHWGYYREPRDRENGFLGFLDQQYWMNVDNTEDLELALNHIHNLVEALKQIDVVTEEALSGGEV